MSSNEKKSSFELNFPHLCELYQDLGNDAFDGWFNILPHKIFATKLSLSYFEQLEHTLGSLSDVAWLSLKSKLGKQSNSSRRELLSLLNEAAGYKRFLEILDEKHIGFDQIVPPPQPPTKRRTEKEPEWFAIRGGNVVAAMEVKTVFNSDYEDEFVDSNTKKIEAGELPNVRRLMPILSHGFYNKISDHVRKAKSQLAAVQGELELLVIFLVLNIDYEAAHVSDIRNKVEHFLQDQQSGNLTIVAEMRSPFLN
ncbi:hypothetical protein [Bremerella alba]|uniref:Uncharacterized protein n=1 Tax=Bremerella alba TaxID=980252 RepID=A0A7V9A8N6_9BACT|nr:hypothetical protein [Bremerella alba]MBA2116675.1 hypothetical protein [Bremerella alba]